MLVFLAAFDLNEGLMLFVCLFVFFWLVFLVGVKSTKCNGLGRGKDGGRNMEQTGRV